MLKLLYMGSPVSAVFGSPVFWFLSFAVNFLKAVERYGNRTKPQVIYKPIPAMRFSTMFTS